MEGGPIFWYRYLRLRLFQHKLFSTYGWHEGKCLCLCLRHIRLFSSGQEWSNRSSTHLLSWFEISVIHFCSGQYVSVSLGTKSWHDQAYEYHFVPEHTGRHALFLKKTGTSSVPAILLVDLGPSWWFWPLFGHSELFHQVSVWLCESKPGNVFYHWFQPERMEDRKR